LVSEPWPRLGLGCAALGQPDLTDAQAESVIAAAIERGIRFFDVAPLYGGGLGEERLGHALARLNRDDYVLCTKTGVTRPCGEPALAPGATRRREHDLWDYSAEATRASIERSLERLRTDRLDVVHLHDVDAHLDTCLHAHAELQALRATDVVGRIGIGSNRVEPAAQLLECARFDAILLAGRYTLLDQSGAALLTRAHSRDVRVIAGGVFNSGVLAQWPIHSATYDYEPADAGVLARVERIARICAACDTPLAAAALQFTLAHPAIATVLIGPRTVEELEANLRAAEHVIPDTLWTTLAAAGGVPAHFIGPESIPAEAARSH
jgi:D-threo-aldose 1-dehydrogenase